MSDAQTDNHTHTEVCSTQEAKQTYIHRILCPEGAIILNRFDSYMPKS